jgi:hypothetical protein
MVSYEGYVAGWLNSSIRDFLGAFPPTARGLKYALITCLDSNPHPRSLLDSSPELKPLAAEAPPLGTALLLPTRLLLERGSTHRLFYGFDEIWFFPGAPTQAKPESASLVGPARVDQRRLDALGQWMSHNACSLALGDGEGLNFVVKARGLVSYLLAHSMEQPQPSVAPFETADPV